MSYFLALLLPVLLAADPIADADQHAKEKHATESKHDVTADHSGDHSADHSGDKSDDTDHGTPDHPEAKPYDKEVSKADVDASVDAALTRAQDARTQGINKHVIIILGANWCHDSRGLAGWFATERFATMLSAKYEIVYVNAGVPQRKGKARNQHLIKRFKGKKQKNTPYVMLLSHDGQLLNKKTARSWRNSASRGEDNIYNYFANQEWMKRD